MEALEEKFLKFEEDGITWFILKKDWELFMEFHKDMSMQKPTIRFEMMDLKENNNGAERFFLEFQEG